MFSNFKRVTLQCYQYTHKQPTHIKQVNVTDTFEVTTPCI